MDEMPIQYAEPEPGTQDDAYRLVLALAKYVAIVVAVTGCAYIAFNSPWWLQYAAANL